MNTGFDIIDAENNAVKSIQEIDKKVIDELSKGSMSDAEKITKLRFEQMLKGLYLTQDPMNLR